MRNYPRFTHIKSAITRGQDGNQRDISLVSIEDDLNSIVQQGRSFIVFANDESVSKDTEVNILIKTGDKPLHLVVEVNTVGQWRFQSYSGVTVSANGTELTPVPRKQGTDVVMGSDFFLDPTVSDLGTNRFCFCFGAGTTASRASSTQYIDNLESVFAPNTNFIIKMTNLSGTTSYLSAILNLHEDY